MLHPPPTSTLFPYTTLFRSPSSIARSLRRARSTASSASSPPPTSPASTRTAARSRSEEHTSELQSPCNLVCRLLLEKKKTLIIKASACATSYIEHTLYVHIT